MNICKACSIEHNIKLKRAKWYAIGTCSLCQKRHILYGVDLNITNVLQIANLLRDGRCPVCDEEINVGEIICDSCYNRAEHYRVVGPPLSSA